MPEINRFGPVFRKRTLALRDLHAWCLLVSVLGNISEWKASRIRQKKIKCNAVVTEISTNKDGALERRTFQRCHSYMPSLTHTNKMQAAVWEKAWPWAEWQLPLMGAWMPLSKRGIWISTSAPTAEATATLYTFRFVCNPMKCLVHSGKLLLRIWTTKQNGNYFLATIMKISSFPILPFFLRIPTQSFLSKIIKTIS